MRVMNIVILLLVLSGVLGLGSASFDGNVSFLLALTGFVAAVVALLICAVVVVINSRLLNLSVRSGSSTNDKQ